MLTNQITHHGAWNNVTGSCHELNISPECSVLIDCGLFQGNDSPPGNNGQNIEFSIQNVQALFITHCHIDHVGRLPWLLIAGFRGPIYCSEATALLLPLVIEDAIRLSFTRDSKLINATKNLISKQLIPVSYNQWTTVELPGATPFQARFQQAGHILGSAYIEFEIAEKRIVFSGDLGCKNTPLLPDPTPLQRADLLVLESTYGNRNHEDRSQRQLRLRKVIEHCVEDGGAVLIPAFSIGRTQELLYELEDIIHKHGNAENHWKDIQVILDSPLAAQFTRQYRKMKKLWDCEAKSRLQDNRHPLNFDRLHIIESHSQHQALVQHLKASGTPCIVIASSGMCTGGRISNYLKALLPDKRTDVVFVGYQASGTPGADILRYGPRGGYVVMDQERVEIRAQVHSLGGYSAHADQNELLEFVEHAVENGGIGEIRLVHGEPEAKSALQAILQQRFAVKVS